MPRLVNAVNHQATFVDNWLVVTEVTLAEARVCEAPQPSGAHPDGVTMQENTVSPSPDRTDPFARFNVRSAP